MNALAPTLTDEGKPDHNDCFTFALACALVQTGGIPVQRGATGLTLTADDCYATDWQLADEPTASTYVTRLIDERDELAIKLDDLNAALASPQPAKIDDEHWALLHLQSTQMSQYHGTLSQRLMV